MHGRFAKYRYTGDAHELARAAEEGMVPIFEAQGGFQAYSLFESDGLILSFSAWDTAEGAEAGSKAAAEWVASNMADSITLEEVWTGEILLATKLGVSAKAGATA